MVVESSGYERLLKISDLNSLNKMVKIDCDRLLKTIPVNGIARGNIYLDMNGISFPDLVSVEFAMLIATTSENKLKEYRLRRTCNI